MLILLYSIVKYNMYIHIIYLRCTLNNKVIYYVQCTMYNVQLQCAMYIDMYFINLIFYLLILLLFLDFQIQHLQKLQKSVKTLIL